MKIRQLFLRRIRLLTVGSPIVRNVKDGVVRSTGDTVLIGHCAPQSAVPTYPIIQVG